MNILSSAEHPGQLDCGFHIFFIVLSLSHTIQFYDWSNSGTSIIQWYNIPGQSAVAQCSRFGRWHVSCCTAGPTVHTIGVHVNTARKHSRQKMTPVFTGRVRYTRDQHASYDTRVHGPFPRPWTRMSKITPVFTGRIFEHGPWTRVMCTEL